MGMVRAPRPETPEHLLLGVGAFYKNFVIGTDTPFNSTGKEKCIGATDGGGSFSATPSVREITCDGLPGKVKGMKTNDGWDASITAKVKEITLDNLKLALGSTTVTSMTTISASKIVANNDIAGTDYCTNITWAGTLADNTTPVYIVLKNALGQNGLSMSMTDKSEMVIDVTLFANYDLNDLDTPPFEIIYPNA